MIRKCLGTSLFAAVILLASRAWGETKPLALDEPAPALSATTLDGKAVDLADFKGKPLVIHFGSITEPIFRMRAPQAEKLAAKYGDKVTFVVVYAHESHPADSGEALELNTNEGFAIAQPTSEEERVKLAGQAAERLGIKSEKMLVDAWSNATALRYGDYPNMTFIVDANGKLQAGYAWMDPKAVQVAIDALLAGKPIPPEYRGRTKPSDTGALDYTNSALDMTGGRAGPGAIAVVIDRMNLTGAQKQAIFPALGEFMADLRNFRERRVKAAQPAAGAPGAAPQAAGENPDQLQKDIEVLRGSMEKLRDTAKANLSPEQFDKFMGALDVGPLRRLINQPGTAGGAAGK